RRWKIEVINQQRCPRPGVIDTAVQVIPIVRIIIDTYTKSFAPPRRCLIISTHVDFSSVLPIFSRRDSLLTNTPQLPYGVCPFIRWERFNQDEQPVIPSVGWRLS